jgi:GT2 family glycosyltransferase
MSQNYPILDIVVVDNYYSQEERRRLQELLPDQISLVLSDKNLGYAGGNNLGIKYVGLPKPRFYLVVNSDVRLKTPDDLRLLYEASTSDSSIAACSPLIYDPSVSSGNAPEVENTIQVRRLPSFLTSLIVNSWFLSRIFRPVSRRYVYKDRMPFPPNSVVHVETINGACFLISNEAITSLGGLDEGTFLYYEEIILGMQLKSIGLKSALATTVKVEHLQGSSSEESAGRFVINRRLQALKSELYWCQKYLNVNRAGQLLLVLVRSADIITKAVLRILSGKNK